MRKLRADAGVYRLAANVRASTGRFRGNVRCRCTNYLCRARWTLAKSPHEYVRWPTCKDCGSPLRVDFYRQTKAENKKSGICYCGDFHFPHRHNKAAAS